jgi:hypothetical protein
VTDVLIISSGASTLTASLQEIKLSLHNIIIKKEEIVN